MNKVIVAGSRSIDDYNLVKQAILESKFTIDVLICGMARGVDLISRNICLENNIPIEEYPAHWNDLTEGPVSVKVNQFGKKYNVLAGHNRNKRMSEVASHLIAIIKNNSSGTRNMIQLAEEKGLTVYIKTV